MKMPWKGREGHVLFVLLPTTMFLATRWNSKRIIEIPTQRQTVISHPVLMMREFNCAYMDNAYFDRSHDIWTSLNLTIHSISLSKNALSFAFY